MFLIAFIVTVITGIPSWSGLCLQTVVMAAFYGAFLIIAQVLLIKAMDIGDVSVSSLFYSCGFLVPIFASVFIYKESVSWTQAVGVVLIIISFVVAVEKKGETGIRWFIFAIAALLCNGMVGLSQKVFRMSDFGHQQSGFMMIAFLREA
jgi:multidrug transporter EmrE-like cation transporter